MAEERTKITLMNEIDGFSFTGVLENSLEMTVDKTSYPIEIGAQATDNAIVKNIKYSLKGAVSNVSTGLSVDNIATGVLSNFMGSVGTSILTTTSAKALTKKDKPAKALRTIMDKLNQKKTFSMFTGELQIDNLMITSLKRTKDTSNETTLVFELELEENKTLSLLMSDQTSFEPFPEKLANDNTKTQASGLLEKGQQAFSDLSDSAVKEYNSLRKSIGEFFDKKTEGVI